MLNVLEGITRGVAMKAFVQHTEGLAIRNDEFRKVLHTATRCRIVLMALKPQEDIGAEVHQLGQCFEVEAGSGEVVVDGVRTPFRAEFAVSVPAGTKQNIGNTGAAPLKLCTLYAALNHGDGVVHDTRAAGEAAGEHSDGRTSS